MPLAQVALEILSHFAPPGDQEICVGEFYECYDILLSSNACPLSEQWNVAKTCITPGALAANSIITRQHLNNASNQVEPNWPAVYLLAMVWGFGSVVDTPAKDGPAKLFVSTQTTGAEERIIRTANLVLGGNLQDAFGGLCKADGANKLRQIGSSFGTKYLYAVGLRNPADANPKPLVFDARVKRSLRALPGGPPAWLPMNQPNHYHDYCACMGESADILGDAWTAYNLEQLLFEHNGDFA